MSFVANTNPISDFVKHESYTIPQPVNSLPIKRLFDYRFGKLRESTKLPREFQLNNTLLDEEVILKIKMVGVNYGKDFELLKHDKFNPKINIVPGNKIIGKILNVMKNSKSSDFLNNSHKYMVFPYSNCLIQDTNNLCLNCQHLFHNQINLTSANYQQYSKFKCMRRWEYGYTIDGGLQDFLKIKKPGDTLIKIPDSISLHDCVFSMEILLPFYSFLKNNFYNFQTNQLSVDGRVLIILNDISKEINDILIVLKYFNIDQKNFSFIDAGKIHELMNSDFEDEKVSYKSIFNHIFIFSLSDLNISFGLYSIISTGLESTKSRYNLVLFDQYNPNCLIKHKSLNKYHPDKLIHHYELSYQDRINLIELLSIISDLNTSSKSSPLDSLESTRPSVTSIETSASTFSIHSDSTSNTVLSRNGSQNHHQQNSKKKQIRFREDESIIDAEPPLQKEKQKHQNKHKHQNHFSWLYYDKDFDLCNDYEYSDDESEDAFDDLYQESFGFRNEKSNLIKMHTVRQINMHLNSNQSLSRVCYTNKSNKPVKINAFIFT